MEGGFGPDVQERLRLLKSPLALALYAIYQAQLAQQVATTYLGQRTGSLVLDGQMGRGRSASLRAGIAFLDIRGFTALSHELGVEGIVPLLNAVFEAIDEAVRPLGGEILKLIGDAALVVFPLEEEADSNLLAILRSLLDAGQSAWDATAELGQPLRLGCGFHTGDVLYGNVGSRSRHDFTVMGPAVNLASRLETLTKSLSADLVISHKVAHACRHSCGGPAGAEEALDASVRSYDAVSVPGVPEPLRVWTVNRRRSDEEEREG
jgi:adenylate cyclase